MRLPIVSTDHVLGREALSRAWARGLEMVAGSADALVQRDACQRVFSEAARGVPAFDLAFGFSGGVTPDRLADLLRSDQAGLPSRVVPPVGWSDEQVSDAISSLGYQPRRLMFWSLAKARLDLEASPDVRFQVLPARSVYGDVEAITRSRFADLGDRAAERHVNAAKLALDEPRLDTLILRKSGVPVGTCSVLTVNTTGLILDLYALPDSALGLHEALLWHALDLCGRSQHVSVSAVLDGPTAKDRIWLEAGFVSVPGVTVWDMPG